MGSKKLLVLSAALVLGLTACGKNKPGVGVYTFNRFTTVSPSNWNELTYRDANDTQILSNIVSSFYEFDFEFDANGEIVDGGFAVEYSASTALEDVTAQYAVADNKWGLAEDAEKQAYKITLRDDLKWDDGTPIHAADFVYSAKELLNPLFLNYRANSLYQGNLTVHGAKSYVFQGSHAYGETMIDEDYSDDRYVPLENFYVHESAPFKDGRTNVYGYDDADGNFHDVALDTNSGGVWTSKSFNYYFDYYIANEVYYWGHRGYWTIGQYQDEEGYMPYYAVGDEDEKIVLKLKLNEAGDDYAECWDVSGDTPVALTYDESDASNPVWKNAAGEVVYERKLVAPVMVNFAPAQKLYDLGKANKTEGQEGFAVLDTAEKVQWLGEATAFINTNGQCKTLEEYAAVRGDYAYIEWEEWVFVGEDLPEYAWEDVGVLATAENEITLILDKPLALLNDDETLNYRAAYILGSLQLVKQDLYESCKQEPKPGAKLWTSNYNSSLETTASWGPYKLTSFQVDKQYILEKNDNWFGYKLDQYKGQYQTTRIVTDVVAKWETAWLLFKAGDLTSIGIDVSIADEYKTSSRAIFTPGDSVWSFQIQSSESALKGRETDGYDKEIIANQKFRKALSVGLNRVDYANKCFTADRPCLTLFTELHYYDVENGGKYTATTAWKEMICRFYEVDPNDYPSLDDAVNSITGYDLTLARRLLTEAYEETYAAGKISATDKVQILVGVSTYSTLYQRIVAYLTEAWTTLAEGTPLEGRIEVEVKEFGNSWSTDFKEKGAYDLIPAAGWTGSAWDIPNLMDAYLNKEYMYSAAWDTTKEMLTLTVDGKEYTMSLFDWNNCLQGLTDAKYNWGEGFLDNEERLKIMAAVEEQILNKAYSIPTVADYTATLLSNKVEYITRDYNTFMGYGGLRYMTYNYDDYGWEAVKTSFDYRQ